jgi:transaldolase
MPMETLEAYERHGAPALRLTEDAPDGADVIERLSEVGVDMHAVAAQLEAEGIDKFVQPYDAILRAIERKADAR